MTNPTMLRVGRFLVAFLLIPPWVAFCVAVYWLFLDTTPVIEVVYEHPTFLKGPAHDRREAEELSVTTVKSFETIYIYREVCVRGSPVSGTIKAVWESGSFTWSAPERTIPDFPLGCTAQTFNLQAPTSNPTRDFIYKSTWELEQNPLLTIRLPVNDLSIRVLAPNNETDLIRR